MKLQKLFSLENLEKNIKNIWSKFPVSVIIIFLIAGLFFTELHYNDVIEDLLNKKIFVVILSLIATFIFSIWTYLSTENTNYSKLKRNLFQIIPIIFWISFYNIFGLDPTLESIIFAFLSFAWIIAFIYFAPYLKSLFLPLQGGDAWKAEGAVSQTTFYTYFYNISVVILTSFIFGWVLFGLWAIWINATDALFDLNIREKYTYWNWSILAFSVISPLFLLSQLPDKKSFLADRFNGNEFFSFLVKFVAVPFIYLYFFILYAYSIKVLANFGDWPKWEISWLVIGFSIFGYLAYSFSYIFEKDSKAIKLFRKIFPYAVIPQIFMLFYAIYLRIAQYDLTVNRYFIVIFGLWLLLVSLHFIFSKKKSLIAIPISLAFFIILISIFPKFNVYSYPVERQYNRLETNLEKAKILQNWEIIPLKNYSDISKDLSKNIYSGIDYICDFDNCNKIKELFPRIYSEIEKNNKLEWEKNHKEEIERLLKKKNNKICEYNKYWYAPNSNCFNKTWLEKLKKEKYEWVDKWTIIDKITEKIKVKKYFNKFEENRKYFEYSKEYTQDFFPINIEWYSKMYNIKNLNKFEKNKDFAEFNSDTNEIIITLDWNKKEKINISEISKKLIEKFWKNTKRNLDKKDLIFEINQNWKIYKLMFDNVSVKNPDYKEKKDNKKWIYFSDYSNWYILVK